MNWDAIGAIAELLGAIGVIASRAESTPDQHIHPLPVELLAPLMQAAKEEGLNAEGFVMLLLDAGLRLGEGRGLRWGKIHWAEKYLLIDGNIPTGGTGEIEEPKSGRSRKVQLSHRARSDTRGRS